MEAGNNVDMGMVLISSDEANSLFDPSSTHFFVSHAFAAKLKDSPSTLTHGVVVSTPT